MFSLRGYCTWETCEKLSSFISFNALTYFGDFFFYSSLSTVGGPTTHIYCSLYNWFYFVSGFLYSLSKRIQFLADFCYICGIHSIQISAMKLSAIWLPRQKLKNKIYLSSASAIFLLKYPTKLCICFTIRFGSLLQFLRECLI